MEVFTKSEHFTALLDKKLNCLNKLSVTLSDIHCILLYLFLFQMGEGGKKKGGLGSGGGERAIVNEQLHRAFLEKHPYQQFSEEEVAEAKELLQ